MEIFNAANLIQIEDITDKEKIGDLEIAANLAKLIKIIFDIYKQIPFNINILINAKNLYQTLEGIDARSLIIKNTYYLRIQKLNEYLL